MDADLRRVFILVLLSPSLHLVSSDLRDIEYIVISDECTWEHADAHCRKFYGRLITIRHKEQDDLLEDNIWIGLRHIDGSWRWPGGEELSYSNWKSDEPKHPMGCVKRKSHWETDYCNEKKKFNCDIEHLVLIREEKTWEEALQHCRDMCSLGHNMCYDLATLATPDDHRFAYEEAQKATTIEVWTGLRFLAGRWFWVGDGGQTIPSTLPVCPDHYNFCGTVSKASSGLQTRNCTERRNFFCQRWLCTS